MPWDASPSAQQVRRYDTAGKTVVELLGEIDITVVPRATAELDAATRGPRAEVVIDLVRVEFLDCYGLKPLCRARRRVKQQRGRLTLVCPHQNIRRLLGIVGLGRAFDLAHTLDEALHGRGPAR